METAAVTAQSIEISKKVKSAIKAKLMELKAYVDDELPDYIMVLVGNKKTKDQMDDDLRLFLGENTEHFTSWLHIALQKLNAATVLQNPKTVKEKEKKKEVEKVENPEIVMEEKKKHKKKKDKSEKKKEKKEKKKKKDKDREREKSEKSLLKAQKNKNKAVSPEIILSGKEVTLPAAVNNTNEKSVSSSPLPDGESNGDVNKSEGLGNVYRKGEEEENLAEDIVDLRPDADDLALDLDDEILPKKRKTGSSKKDDNPEEFRAKMNIEIKVSNNGEKRTSAIVISEAEEGTKTGSIHDRLGPATNSSSSKRIINLREESSFPSKFSTSKGDGLGRAVSSAIASAVKSVTLGTSKSSEIKTGKKLEARVRPLISSKPKPEERQTSAEAPQISTARVVSTVGAILKRSHSIDDDDSEQPTAKRLSGVASKVEVTPRPRRPGSMQANTALILRAVADAHKSVNKPTKKLSEERDDENKKGLFSRSYQERQSQRLGLTVGEGKNVKKFAITVPNALLKENVEMHLAGKSVELSRKGETFLEEVEMEEDFITQVEPMTVEECIETKTMELVEEGPEKPPHLKGGAIKKLVAAQANDPSGSTRFIVTLDGFGNETGDLRSRLSGRPVRTPSLDEEEYIEEVEEWEEEVEEMEGVSTPPIEGGGTSLGGTTVGTKTKLKIDPPVFSPKKEERCRYWPACKDGDACKFIHPSKICNTFPKCRFADKCIYIHPNCKFDAACAKLNCPFTHASSRQIPTSSVTMKTKAATLSVSKTMCYFYPKCVNMNCPYQHPKQICRYGKVCNMPSCPYVHPEVTTGALLKWTKPKTSTSTTSSTVTRPVTQSVTSSLTTSTSTLSTDKTLITSSVETQ